MQHYKKNGIEWLEFDLLADIPKVKHATFLRHGGSSTGSFSSLNTGWHVGDFPFHVEKNIERIKQQLSSEISSWNGFCSSRASHGKEICIVTEKTPQDLVDFDSLITITPRRSLLMKHADCQIALFYDPVHHIAANVHAGWRGSTLNIYQKTIDVMKYQFGAQPSNILACISPSLGPQHGEFVYYQKELPQEFWKFQIRPHFFDFWSISEMQLQEAGILPHHIEIARLCTYADPSHFFSHRRDKITGRHATCITLL